MLKPHIILLSFFCIILISSCGPKNAVLSQELGVILKFREGVQEDKKVLVMKELGLKKTRNLELIHAFACTYIGAKSFRELQNEASQFPEIEYIEPDFPVKIE